MNKVILEQNITSKIQAGIALLNPGLVSKMECVQLPEDIKQYKQPDVGKFRISVGYDMSNYKDLLNTEAVIQDEELTFIVTIQSRTLRGDIGIYTIHELVEKCVIGYKPNDCTRRIWSVYFGPPKTMEARIDDTWLYEYHIKTMAVSVQNDDIADQQVTSSYKSSSPIVINGDTPPPVPQLPPVEPIISMTEGPTQ